MTAESFEYGETVEDVFVFVQEVVLPLMKDYEHFGNFLFRLNTNDEFDASVQILPNRFRISINTGLINRLVEFIELGIGADSSALQTHILALESADISVDTRLNLILVSGIVFVLLHEIYHAIGGHSEFCVQAQKVDRAGKLSELDALQLRGLSIPDDTLDMIELEADGGAYATTLEFSRQIYATVTDSAPLPMQQIDWVEQSVILGSLSALAILQAINPIKDKNDQSSVFPTIRILNVCSANYRAMASPQFATIEGIPDQPLDVEESKARQVASRYARTILPAISVLDDMLNNVFGSRHFMVPTQHDDGRQGSQAMNSDLMRDIQQLLSGRAPRYSKAGDQLASYVERRVEFMSAMAKYRRADLWSL